MADTADHLNERARLLGHAFAPLDKVWFGKPYDWHEPLNVADFTSGERVRYARRGDRERAVLFETFVPIGIQDRRETEIVMATDRLIDRLTATGRNYDGVVPVPISYEGEVRRLTGSSEAFSHGLTQSMELSLKFTQGGEASFAKFEQEIKLGFEARQDWERGSTEENEIRRMAGIAPECPAGYDVEFTLTRYGRRLKLKVTGTAKLDHSVRVGKFQKGRWKGNHGKGGRLWPRWAAYDSFYEQCLPVLKGEAPRDLMFAQHFREHPAPDWLIDRLERALPIPFEHTSAEFDGATRIDQDQNVLRGPKAA